MRTFLLIIAFICSLSLITLAYSQTEVNQALDQPVTNTASGNCTLGSQIPSNVPIGANPEVIIKPDFCIYYSAYVQGACCCKSSDGKLGCPNNPICKQARDQTKR